MEYKATSGLSVREVFPFWYEIGPYQNCCLIFSDPKGNDIISFLAVWDDKTAKLPKEIFDHKNVFVVENLSIETMKRVVSNITSLHVDDIFMRNIINV